MTRALMAQNSALTARPVRGRPFQPGQSGNPGGRPRGPVAAIRARTRDGEELVGFMLDVLRGRMPGTHLRDRMAAAEWLADRGFGRPVQAVGVAMTSPEDDRIPFELLRRLMEPSAPSDND